MATGMAMAAMAAEAYSAYSQSKHGKGGGASGAQAGLNELGTGSGFNELNPWVQQGGGALSNYSTGLGQMKDPQAFYQNMMKGYTQSPQAMQAQAAGIKASDAGASASGMLGSGAQQTALQKQGQGITAADQQNYLNNMMNIHGQYMHGLSDESHMGLSGATSLSQMLAHLESERAQLAMGGEMSRQSGKQGAMGSMGGLAAALGQHYMQSGGGSA